MKKKIVAIVSMLALVAVLATCLVACIPQSAKKASDSLQEKGYTILFELNEDDLDAEEKEDGMTGVLVARKGALLKGEYVVAVWFATAEEARDNRDDAAELIADYTGKDEDEVKEALFVSGKCIYFGTTEDAVKDFKG